MSISLIHAHKPAGPVDTAAGAPRRRTKVLLTCGITSSLLYGAMIWLVTYDGYNPISQTVSELSAWGTSTRPLWLVLGTIWDLLIIAFGLGLWAAGRGRRSLRMAGVLLGTYGLLGFAYPFSAMHRREVLAAGGATAADTAHLVLVAVGGLLMAGAIAFAAAAFGARFRWYSLATVIALVAFGVLTSKDATRVQADLPTPWAGLWERISIMAFLAWVAVLGVSVWRSQARRVRPEGRSGRVRY